MPTIIAFVTSIVYYWLFTDAGVSCKSVEIEFPDDEDYDGIELIDEDVLGIIENATSRLDLVLIKLEQRRYAPISTHSLRLIEHVNKLVSTL